MDRLFKMPERRRQLSLKRFFRKAITGDEDTRIRDHVFGAPAITGDEDSSASFGAILAAYTKTDSSGYYGIKKAVSRQLGRRLTGTEKQLIEHNLDTRERRAAAAHATRRHAAEAFLRSLASSRERQYLLQVLQPTHAPGARCAVKVMAMDGTSVSMELLPELPPSGLGSPSPRAAAVTIADVRAELRRVQPLWGVARAQLFQKGREEPLEDSAPLASWRPNPLFITIPCGGAEILLNAIHSSKALQPFPNECMVRARVLAVNARSGDFSVQVVSTDGDDLRSDLAKPSRACQQTPLDVKAERVIGAVVPDSETHAVGDVLLVRVAARAGRETGARRTTNRDCSPRL
jgi:hypothetical protein